MSAQATFWAWSLGIPASAKYVLLCLCNCHNRVTGECFPSIPYVAKMTGLNRKTVIQWLLWLEENGLCEVVRRDGTANRYRLKMPEPVPKTGLPQSQIRDGYQSQIRDSNLKGNLKLNTAPEKERSSPQRKTSIPPDFSISDGVREWANKNGHHNLEARLEHFRDACEAKDYQYVNWDSAFKTAIRQDWARINKQSTAMEEYL